MNKHPLFRRNVEELTNFVSADSYKARFSAMNITTATASLDSTCNNNNTFRHVI